MFNAILDAIARKAARRIEPISDVEKVESINLSEGDTLFVTANLDGLKPEHFQKMAQGLEKAFPGHRVCVVPKGSEVSRVRQVPPLVEGKSKRGGLNDR